MLWIIIACTNIVCHATPYSRSDHHPGFVWLTGSFAHRLHLINSCSEPLHSSLQLFGGHTNVIVLLELRRLQKQSAVKLSWQAAGFLLRALEAQCIHVLLCFLLRITELSANNFQVLIQAARVLPCPVSHTNKEKFYSQRWRRLTPPLLLLGVSTMMCRYQRHNGAVKPLALNCRTACSVISIFEFLQTNTSGFKATLWSRRMWRTACQSSWDTLLMTCTSVEKPSTSSKSAAHRFVLHI